jgi:hypothetical protein
MRRLGIVAVGAVFMLLGAVVIGCEESEPRLEIASSPYASVVPSCPSGYREESSSYDKPPRGTAYTDAGITAITERKCQEGEFTLIMSVMEFATGADAKRYMDDRARDAEESNPDDIIEVFDMQYHTDWKPAAPGEQFLDLDYRSNPIYEPDDELVGPWSIQNVLWVRAGSLVLEVSGITEEDVDVDWRQGIVVGDARWQQSERLMDDMLAAMRARQSQ